ncbi:hypothetical protein XBJ2_2580032 [Xenorhabdus bovienii str. Jollieti]|uniref:Uncharacterized protein n=2 Tax=Xenorhabdus bovienii TaxID=40576 RepID=D3UXJ1_XENBS|nr:hypothetical protein [Xenorhabdus bovienii]MDE1480202.1 hypothetical protein [Xenorhabdus bovienii]MDE9511893.1 hypothetical protein [Xenorhabdus bovienii]MDE9523535.1 hypothetical protein [Xenorhabdus bovienii]CBJ80366.1 hypothetical protein XBJ1_1233 [Xenorhabdus bovienii SS-2004]CDH29385.1 hypothetical protein XBJ2_2580032 [Xenorhabdus bovienii str. Jollieti]
MSDISIQGEPRDYYKILIKSDDSECYQANRRTIREIMKVINGATEKYQENGDSDTVIQMHQDYYDAFDVFILNEPDDAKIAMRSVLAEEMKAKECELNIGGGSIPKVIGFLLTFIGLFVCFYACTMNISVGYYDKVINAGLVADRQLYMTAGVGITIIGSLAILFSLLLGKMGKRFIARQ